MKKLKTLFSVLTALVLAGTVVGLAGCSHEHEYNTAVWAKDDSGHWHAATCGHTDEKIDFESHTYNSNYKCTTCGWQHTHSYASTYSYDAYTHWNECSCGLKKNETKHDWENGQCSVCHMEMPSIGIDVTKTTTEYPLASGTAAGPSVANISVADLTVKILNADESESSTLTAADYTVKCYNGAEEVTDLSAVGPGAYNLWVSANIDVGGETKECKSFVVVYVIDEFESLEWDYGAEGAVYTQPLSILDSMSSTWKFTAKYKSGRTKTVTVDDCIISGLTTDSVTKSATATVAYTSLNAKGESESKSAQVFYEITAASKTINTYTYSYTALGTLSEKYKFPVGALPGDANAFLSVVNEGAAIYRNSGSTQVLEIKGEALSITVTEVAKLTISVSSTSSSNTSAIAIKNAAGEYIAATSVSSSVVKDDDYNIYGLPGKSHTITFVITTPGIYTICTADEFTSNGDTTDTNRNTRIDSLVLIEEISNNG